MISAMRCRPGSTRRSTIGRTGRRRGEVVGPIAGPAVERRVEVGPASRGDLLDDVRAGRSRRRAPGRPVVTVAVTPALRRPRPPAAPRAAASSVSTARPASIVSAARSIPASSVSTSPATSRAAPGVEQHDVPSRSGLAAEDAFDHAGVLLGRAAGEPGRRRHLSPSFEARDHVPLDALGPDVVEHAAVVERQLVDPVAVDDERPLRPEPHGDLGHPLGGRRVADAEELARRAGGVGQRAEEVERGPDADLPAGRAGVAHRRVEVRREHEREPDVAERGAGRCGVVVDPDPEGVEDVGRAGLRRDGAVAVLRDRDAGARPRRARRSSRC